MKFQDYIEENHKLGTFDEFDARVGYSRCTFIFDSQENEWTKGPHLLTYRSYHSSCAIKSEDGKIESIIIVGGEEFDKEEPSNTTEILKLNEQRWIQGPLLPEGITDSSCVALPPIMNYACLVIGGRTEEGLSSNVYALDKSLSTWTHLGKLTAGLCDHIAIPLS